MQYNEAEKKRILDQGMLTRSLIENEVALKKCRLFGEMASDPSVKAFFKDQVRGLEDAQEFIRKGLAELG